MNRFFKSFAFILSLSLYGSSLGMSSNIHAMRWEEISPEKKEVAFKAAGMKATIKRWVSAAKDGISSPCSAEDMKDPTEFERFLSTRRSELSSTVHNAGFSSTEQARILSMQLSRLDPLMERYRSGVLSVWRNQAIQTAFSGLSRLFSEFSCPMDDSPTPFHNYIANLRPLAEAYERFNEFLEQHFSAGGRDNTWIVRRDIFPGLIIPGQGQVQDLLNPETRQRHAQLSRKVEEALGLAQKSVERSQRLGRRDEGIMAVGGAAKPLLIHLDEVVPQVLRYQGLSEPVTLVGEEETLTWFQNLHDGGVISFDPVTRSAVRSGLETINRHAFPYEAADHRIPSREYFRALTIWKLITERYGHTFPEVGDTLATIFLDVAEQDGKCATGAMGRAALTSYKAAQFLMKLPPK